MKYYYHPISPNCRKTTAVLDHLGMDAERVLLDLPKGEHMNPDFLAVNPNGKVPALEDGDTCVWESNSIIIHIANKAGSDLWPADQRRYDILRWMFWEQGHLMQATGIVFFQRLLKPMLGQETDEGRVGDSLKNFGRLAKVLDDHLARSTHLVGNDLTLADFAVAGNFAFAEPAGLPMDDHANIQRWLAAMDEIPAWKAAAPPPMGG
jgi:glutathione S-transferase